MTDLTKAEFLNLLRCSHGHIHNQEYGKPCPMCELKSKEQMFGNVLAVVHRDGGHYISNHGWKKACEDAEIIICDMRRDLEAK